LRFTISSPVTGWTFDLYGHFIQSSSRVAFAEGFELLARLASSTTPWQQAYEFLCLMNAGKWYEIVSAK
jgi:hypothetical protein